MEEPGLRISRKKTEYLGCNEHQDAHVHMEAYVISKWGIHDLPKELLHFL